MQRPMEEKPDGGTSKIIENRQTMLNDMNEEGASNDNDTSPPITMKTWLAILSLIVRFTSVQSPNNSCC
jgi:hypothetical protein